MRGAAPAAIASSAPGRICLFGEHQDYLGLPVIAMAIDLRIELRGRRRDDGDATLRIELPDLGRRDAFNPNEEPVYRHGRDYLPAAANVLRRLGLSWPAGYDIRVTSRIPINSGASSSSALQVAWVGFLLAAAGDARATDPLFVAEIAFQSEVAEFGSPGGMMDQFSTALGGMIYLETRPPYRVERLPARDWALIILAIALVWTSEFINTALEAVVDLASPQQHRLARVGKDVGAAAVLIAAISSALIGFLLLGPPLWARIGAFFLQRHK